METVIAIFIKTFNPIFGIFRPTNVLILKTCKQPFSCTYIGQVDMYVPSSVKIDRVVFSPDIF